MGNRALESDVADCIVYGRWFLANPDLPERFLQNKPLNKYKRDLFYVNEQVRLGPVVRMTVGCADMLFSPVHNWLSACPVGFFFVYKLFDICYI